MLYRSLLLQTVPTTLAQRDQKWLRPRRSAIGRWSFVLSQTLWRRSAESPPSISRRIPRLRRDLNSTRRPLSSAWGSMKPLRRSPSSPTVISLSLSLYFFFFHVFGWVAENFFDYAPMIWILNIERRVFFFWLRLLRLDTEIHFLYAFV